jgi:outer membrane lipoprotein
MVIKRGLLISILIAAWFISGCASKLPQEITTHVEGSPNISDVSENSDKYKGQFVRWGGSIASIEKKEDETWLEVVSRELERHGRPENSDQSAGRFLARVNQFLDPEIYSRGRLITIYGELVGTRDGKIGDKPYKFPVVKSKTAYLWAEYRDLPAYPYYHRPYYYDPFRDPYWDLRWRRHYYYPGYWY